MSNDAQGCTVPPMRDDDQPPAIGVARRDGVWWFITPEGDEFVSLGVNHVEPFLMTAPYNIAHTRARYGTDFTTADGHFNATGGAAREWVSQVKRDLTAWHFTSFGYHTDVPLEMVKEDMHYIARIRVAPVEAYAEPVARPDVFAPAFAHDLDVEARRVCLAHRGERNVLGYAFADVPEWTLGPQRYRPMPVIHPWVDALRSLDAAAPGKRAWLAVLRGRYNDPQSAAAVHGVRVAGWDDLLARTAWPDPEDAAGASADSEAMLAAIAERWYALHAEAIRRYDPHHLILGDKLRGGAMPRFLPPLLARYVDVVVIQWYGRFAEQEATLREIHAATGKPLLLGDSSFSVVQPHQEGAKGIHVASQRDVGEEYARYLREVISLPFVVGWHHCGYIEGWQGLVVEGEPYAARQCGFKDPFEHVHEDAIAHVQRANAHAATWHRGPHEDKTASLEENV